LLISKRADLLRVGDVILGFNVVLFLVAMSLLGVDAALYSILTYLAAAKTLDFVLYGIDEYTAITVISDLNAAIRERVTRDLGRDDAAEVIIACDDSGEPIGFAELSIRPYAEGCHSGRVAYLEGWFVEPAARRKGVGAALLKAAEDWGRASGCTELASDAEIGNDESVSAHRALG